MRTRFIRVKTEDGLTHIIDTTMVERFSEESSRTGTMIHWKDPMKPGTRVQESIQKIGQLLEL